MGSCRIINIKVGRVGGVVEARKIHDICRREGIPVWCGGMLESGIGRAHNLHLASLPNFKLPSDLSASKRYYKEDLIDPPIELREPARSKFRRVQASAFIRWRSGSNGRLCGEEAFTPE